MLQKLGCQTPCWDQARLSSLVNKQVRTCTCSPAFLLYLVVKHLVDLHHFRLFYTARVPQPMLLKTAVQIAVTVSVLAQTSLTIFYLTDDVNFWRKSSFREVAAHCSLLTAHCSLNTAL